MPFGEYDSSNNSMDSMGMQFDSSVYKDMKEESELSEEQKRKLEEERLKELRWEKVKKAGWIFLLTVVLVFFILALINY